MFGVRISRERIKPAWASIRCILSSVLRYEKFLEVGDKNIPMRNVLNSGLCNVRALIVVLYIQSKTSDGFPAVSRR
jgi:hypothetical protein